MKTTSEKRGDLPDHPAGGGGLPGGGGPPKAGPAGTAGQRETSALAPVLLYDGDCGLCTRAVQFVARRDRVGHFRYAALESPVGRSLAGAAVAGGAGDTLILVVGGTVLLRSDAVADILLRLPGWRWVGKVLRTIPRPLRDFGYRGVARVRRRIFPPPNACVLPDAGLRARIVPP